MKLIPVENIIYKTKLTKEKIIERFNIIFSDDKNLRTKLEGRSSPLKYDGYFEEDKFNIAQTSYSTRSAFIPEVTGTIKNSGELQTINIKLGLRRRIKNFAFGLSLLPLAGIAILTIRMINQNYFSFSIFVLIGFLFFIYLIVLLGFKYECIRAKKDLEEIFQVVKSK